MTEPEIQKAVERAQYAIARRRNCLPWRGLSTDEGLVFARAMLACREPVHIIPHSMESPEGKIFVGDCQCGGRNIRKTHKFCPQCGHPIQWESTDAR